MDEILPGIHHWNAFHEGIGERVSSYLVAADGGTLIDPMLPEGGAEALDDRPPARIVLTNRHHYRRSGELVERFGCTVLCEHSGLHEFADGRAVEGFAFGDRLSGAIKALEVGAICSEDTALEISCRDGVLAFADGLIRAEGGELALVSDSLLGGDPQAVKRGLAASFRRLLERDFDTLLFAHGQPMVGGGKAALQEFVQAL